MLAAHFFQFQKDCDLATWLDELPRRCGTYLVLIRGGDRLLELAGYFAHQIRLPYRRGDYHHMYAGAGYEWGTRVRRHLTGTRRNFESPLHAGGAGVQFTLP
jgi:hypothetical protein